MAARTALLWLGVHWHLDLHVHQKAPAAGGPAPVRHRASSAPVRSPDRVD